MAAFVRGTAALVGFYMHQLPMLFTLPEPLKNPDVLAAMLASSASTSTTDVTNAPSSRGAAGPHHTYSDDCQAGHGAEHEVIAKVPRERCVVLRVHNEAATQFNTQLEALKHTLAALHMGKRIMGFETALTVFMVRQGAVVSWWSDCLYLFVFHLRWFVDAVHFFIM